MIPMPSHRKKSDTVVILALGNPGEDYESTYHNAGVIALPAVIKVWAGEEADALTWRTHKHLFEYASAGDFIFARSLTYMNESGIAAAEVLKKFDIPADRLTVLHDESDLMIGDYKISFDRNSGGHKGAQSTIDHLKTKTFWRVRIGIRPVSAKAAAGTTAQRKKAGDFVLSRISAAARKAILTAAERAAQELAQKCADKR